MSRKNLRLLVLAALVSGVYGCGGGTQHGESPVAEAPAPIPSPVPAPVPAPPSAIAASVVIGQASFETGAPRALGADALKEPIGLAITEDGGQLAVADYQNGRILMFDGIPTAHGASASLAVGQLDLTTRSAVASEQILINPPSVAFGNGKMLAVDREGRRALVYATVPADPAAPASFVLGQTDFAATAYAACDASGLAAPFSGIITPDGKTIISDSEFHRVLIWTDPITAHNQSANLVLGQAGFTECGRNRNTGGEGNPGTPSSGSFDEAAGVWSDGTRLVVVDWGNHRVQIWNTFPTENGQAADVVIGFENFETVALRAPGPSSLNHPTGVHSDGTRLTVSDTWNHRALVWDSFPAVNNAPADHVFGQTSFYTGTENDADGNGEADLAPSAGTLNAPQGVLIHDSHLLVSDRLNNRVLVFPLPSP